MTQLNGNGFLLWHDDTKKKSMARKIAEAIEAYINKFSEAPTLVIIAEGIAIPLQLPIDYLGVKLEREIEVRRAATVRENSIMVGTHSTWGAELYEPGPKA